MIQLPRRLRLRGFLIAGALVSVLALTCFRL
jgi:hypothetical protein